MRVCCMCKKEITPDIALRCSRNNDGILNKCKPCQAAYKQENKERIAAIDKKSRAQPVNREKARQANKIRYHKIKDTPEQIEYRRLEYQRNKPAVIKKRRERKKKMIAYKGGVCESCHREYPPAVFDFHHIDPSQKEYLLKELISCSWDRIVKEMDKCILLCSNCHRIVHNQQEE